jgi:hypothetical protein
MQAPVQAPSNPSPKTFAGDAHAFLRSIYQDPAQPPKLRLEAAAKALRHESPRPSSQRANKSPYDELSDDDLARQIKELAVQAGLIPAPAKTCPSDGTDGPEDREPN